MEEVKTRSQARIDAAAKESKDKIHDVVFSEDDYLNDDIFLDKTYEKAEQDLLKYVEKQISLMDDCILKGDVLSFGRLNSALMNYQAIYYSLVSLHQQARISSDLAEEKYKDFYAKKFMEIKLEQASLGKNALTSATAIDYAVRTKYIKELASLKAECILKENQYNAINYIVDGWKNYQFILGTLSRNAQAEAGASGMANSNPKEFGDESELR